MAHATKTALLLFALLLGLSGCPGDDSTDDDDFTPPNNGDDDSGADDDSPTPTSTQNVSILAPGDAPPALQLAAEDAAALLGQVSSLQVLVSQSLAADGQTINIVLGDAGIVNSTFTATELAVLTPEAFRLRRTDISGAIAYVIAGADARGLQYGLYELLEILGFRFFHPEQTYVPSASTLVWPEELDRLEAPDWQRRGYHIHTMHPIEAAEFLLVASPQNRQYARHLIDWLARNKQNYWQFELLRTVDYDRTVDYYRELIDYSHQRLVDAGIVVTWVFQQQKAWKLLPHARSEQREYLEERLGQIMQAPWDHLHLEMGSTEFTQVEDTRQVAWMNDTVEYLAANHPATDASVKVHCSSDQTAPNYGGINFNYLAQFADSRLGIYPHTVMYYGFGGPAPVYGNQNFDELYDWTLSMIDGERKVYYYPESAYWCSFDIDVPLFLPVYLYNRWKDIVLLADKNLDGHVTFTSGHEWNYWLTDWAIARFLWDSSQDWTDAIADFTVIFGEAAKQLTEALTALTLLQQEMLIDKNLASYLAGQDTWDELGYMFGATTHPKPLTFQNLYRLSGADLNAFETKVVGDLATLRDRLVELTAEVESARALTPAAALPWFDELADSFAVDLYRAGHAYHLYAGAGARRFHELGLAADGESVARDHFGKARAIKRFFQTTLARREANYRYPLSYSSTWERSVTSYNFRYLYQASTGYWYERYEKQAIDKNFNPLLMNLIDPIWFFF